MRFVVSWILLIVLLFSYYSNGQKLHIKLISSDFSVDEEYFTKPVIKIHNPQSHDPTLDIDGITLQEIKDPNIKLSLKMETSEGMKEFLATPEIKLCDYFKNPKEVPFLKMILDDMSNYGNFSTSCPLPKGGYYMHGYKMDSSKLPAITPPGKFLLNFHILNENKTIFNANWHAEITSD